jgi:hypothetical protein
LIALLTAATAIAAAEVPSRDELRQSLLVTRTGWYLPIGERYGGIWQLRPAEPEYRRLRPFLPTTDTNRDTPSGFDGRDGFLTAHGDVLTYQTWPALIDFDVYSWRMIRRLPTASDQAEIGWVVQGPTLTPEEAWPLGLEPGTYGVGRCVLQILTAGLEFGQRWCDPTPFPGEPDPDLILGTDAAVLWRESPPEGRQFELFAQLEAFDWWPSRSVRVRLSFDRLRTGLWRCSPHGAVLYSLEDGAVVGPIVEFELELPPVNTDDLLVDRLFHLSANDTLYGVGHSVGGSNPGVKYLFSLDAATGSSQVLGEWYQGLADGAPAALSALGTESREHEQLVPIVAGTSGANGTQWSTGLWLYNPSAEEMSIRVRRVTRPSEVLELTLPPRSSHGVSDALAWVGGGPTGDGTTHEALVVTSDHRWGEQLAVAGRISTPDAELGGWFGHAITAVPGRVGYSNHTQYKALDPEISNVQSPGLRPAHLDLDRRQPGRYRHNLGVVNDLDEPITLRLVWAYADTRERAYMRDIRPAEADRELTVEPHSVRMVRLENFFPPEVRDGWPPRIALLADRPAAVWLSMVDNLTGDATFVPFSNFHYRNDNQDDLLVLPVVAKLTGANGTEWRTDLYGYELNDSYYWDSDAIQDMPLAVYRPSEPDIDCAGAAGLGMEISAHLDGEVGMPLDDWVQTLNDLGYPFSPATAEPWWRTIFPDVIHRFQDCAGESSTKGGLDIATGSWFSGFSRTYATRPDGGTYGGMLPLYPPGGWPAQHFAGLEVKPEQRINVGLHNGNGDHPIAHRLRLYAADGTLAASRQVMVEPYGLLQRPLERLLGLEEGTLDPGLYGLSVIPLDDPDAGVEGRCWAYVSLIDNVTNDPVNLW